MSTVKCNKALVQISRMKPMIDKIHLKKNGVCIITKMLDVVEVTK